MTEQQDNKVSSIANAASRLGESPLGSGLGTGLALLGAALLMLVFVAAPALIKWDGHLFDRKGCYQLQEIKNEVYKVDTCTGKTEKLSDGEETPAKPAQRPNKLSEPTP